MMKCTTAAMMNESNTMIPVKLKTLKLVRNPKAEPNAQEITDSTRRLIERHALFVAP